MSSNIWITTTSAQALEGSTATTAFTFTVWRDGDTSGPASVDWAVSGTGPSPANAADFINGVFPTGHVEIPAGQASASFTVLVVGDTGFESDEGFEVALSNPVGGLIGVPTAPGTATSFTEVVDNSAATALAMANTMLGTAAGLTIVSAQFTGEPAAASMYNAVNLGSAGGRSLALGAGILLTSGDGTPPASNTTDDYSVENFRLGDTALDAYAAMAFTGAGGTADATSLQVGFTVMPVDWRVQVEVAKQCLEERFALNQHDRCLRERSRARRRRFTRFLDQPAGRERVVREKGSRCPRRGQRSWLGGAVSKEAPRRSPFAPQQLEFIDGACVVQVLLCDPSCLRERAFGMKEVHPISRPVAVEVSIDPRCVESLRLQDREPLVDGSWAVVCAVQDRQQMSRQRREHQR